jgi:hypothetical protein
MRSRVVLLVLGLLFAVLTVAAPSASAATRPYVGMPVCKDGSTTGWTCGTVTAVNVTVCYPQGCVTGLARTNMYAAPGDGGAPVYYRTELIGHVVGTAGGSTYFDPV